jgi:hypothetical protein
MSYTEFINNLGTINAPARFADAVPECGGSYWSLRLLVRHIDGSSQEAILMAIFGSQLRVSMPALDDAVEFRWAEGHWQAENGEPVDIEFDHALTVGPWFGSGMGKGSTSLN